MNRKLLFVLGLSSSIIAIFLFVSFMPNQKSWTVPQEYKTMKNPNASSTESIQIGKNLFSRMCASCHGKTGKGDGSKSGSLTVQPGDFTTAAFHNQTEGELFYKTKTGKGDMPGYDKKIPENDIWNMVNYMKSLK